MTVKTSADSRVLPFIVKIEFRVMPGPLNVSEIRVFCSIGFESQVVIEVDEVFVNSMDQLVTFLQASVQTVIQVLIIVFFGVIFFSWQIRKIPFGWSIWRRQVSKRVVNDVIALIKTGQEGGLMFQLPNRCRYSISIQIRFDGLGSDMMISSLEFGLLVDESILPDLLI